MTQSPRLVKAELVLSPKGGASQFRPLGPFLFGESSELQWAGGQAGWRLPSPQRCRGSWAPGSWDSEDVWADPEAWPGSTTLHSISRIVW